MLLEEKSFQLSLECTINVTFECKTCEFQKSENSTFFKVLGLKGVLLCFFTF